MNEFVIGKQIVDWIQKILPGSVRSEMESIGGLIWRGGYQEGASYRRGEMVRFGESTWVCTGTTSERPTFQSDNWDLML